MSIDQRGAGEVSLLIVAVIIGGIIFLWNRLGQTTWQVSYEVTNSNDVMAGPSFNSEGACLNYIHSHSSYGTYGYECGSNCKRFIQDDPTSSFSCDETAD